MADTILTLVQVENLFQSLTSTILNVTDPSIVRIGWPQDGAPGWEISSDVCFILVNYDDSQITRQMEKSYAQADANDATESLSYQLAIRVAWNLYGPNSFDNADRIRSSLFQDTYKATLDASNLALVTDITMPTRIPEMFNGQWWNRTTFYADFNELVVRQSTIPYIQTSNVQALEG